MHGGQLLLALLVIGVPALGLARTVRSARSRSVPRAGGGRSWGWLEHRRAKAMERLRHQHAALRDEARHRRDMLRDATRHRQRLAEQEAAAARKVQAGAEGAAPGPASAGSPPRGRKTVPSRVVRLGDPAQPPAAPPPAPGEPGPSPSAPDPSPGPGSPAGPSPESPAGSGNAPPPGAPVTSRPPSPQSPPQPQPARQQAPTLEGTVMITVAAAPGVEQAIDGLNTITGTAMAGNILAKRAAMLANAEMCRRSATMASALARVMAEPDQHYGVDVTERIQAAALHLNAAAMAWAEADIALKAILTASLQETMAAGKQVPHHEELTETGAR